MDYSYSNQLHSQKRSGFIAISPSQTPGSSEKSGRELRSVDRTLANKHDKDKGVNIQVLLRCRPLSDDEMGVNMPVVISCNEQRREVSAIQHNANKQIDKTFAFDKVFGPTFQQKDLYDQAISPIVNETLEGYNCTIFAYGQTGTGKTYTMEGGGTKTKNGELPHDAGVIPRAVKQIFDILEAQNNDYNMKVTFLELYNEEITDLLAPDEGLKLIEDKAKKPIALMEDGKGSVFVRGLEEEIVTTADEIYRILDKGSSKRRTAETLLNKHGSRSHTIFSITIHIKECTPEGEELIRCGKLNLVDLAGSENILRSGAREGRAREAGEINKSLLTLGRVINALVEHSSHIPYRDSKLTRLLRDSLGGKTKTCIIATISPSTYCLDETLNTLDYAFRAKNIKNKPEVNQKLLKSALIKDLYSEIDRLKQELNAAREKNGIYIPRDRYMHEESKKKAMVEKMEQMEQDSEMKDKQIIELQELYDVKTQLAANLSDKLEETEIVLEETKHSLCDLEEKYRKAKTAIKKKEYYITNLLQSEKALYDYAFELHLELEHAASDVSGLFTKIERKDKLEDGNRTLVHKFCSQLTRQLELLQETVATSVTQQEHHLKRMEGDIHSFVSKKSEAAEEVREQVRKLKTICNARIRDLDDLAVELDSNSQSTFGKLNSEASLHLSSLNDLFKSITVDANVILNEIQSNLSDQVEKLTAYAQQQQEGYFRTLETTRSISEIAAELFNTLGTHAYQLNQLVEEAQVIHNQELHEFEKKFEEHSAIEKQKLLEKVAEMLASVNSKNKKMVQTTVNSLRQSAANRTNQLQQRISTAQNFTFSFKDQWTGHMKETENRYLADIAAVKIGFHNMEGALRHCMLKAGVSAQQWKNAQESLLNLEKENVASMNTIARDGIEANQILRSRLSAAASSALEDFESASNSFLSSIDYSLKLDDDSYKNIDSMTGFCCMELRDLCSCHYHKVMEIGENAEKCLEVEYMLDEPSCSTPTKKSFDLPSIESIEELRTPSYEELMKSFRDEDSSKQAIVDAKDFFPG